MRIGILTFYNANNYGAILQAFSLQRKLVELGYSAECIDYRCPAIEKMHGKLPVKVNMGPSRICKNIIKNIFIGRRIKAFTPFRSNIPHSIAYDPSTIFEANDHYDIFVTGSDQVFNLNLTNGDETFFLPFVKESKKKVAYSASMGKFLDEKEERYKALLKSFDLLSVREETTAKEIQERLSLPCEYIPDPIFLHSADEWKKILGISSDKTQERYLLVYALFGEKLLFDTAEKIASENELKVILITKIMRPQGRFDRLVREVDPRTFVKMIAESEYVITDSFHGTSFSVIFRKKFRVILPPTAPERITDLLTFAGLSDYIVHYSDALVLDKEYTNKATEDLRYKGINFLKKISALG